LSEIDNEISASPLPDVELLRIKARSTSPDDAVRIANAVPGALREFIARTGDTDDQVVLVEPAERPTAPFYPNVKLTLALALFVGLMVNAGLALLRELISDPLPELDELESATGLPVLATVPPLQFAGQGKRPARSEPRRIPSRRVAAEASVATPEGGVREARRSR
jgi:capsular polysaccharide biosynthesis protein